MLTIGLYCISDIAVRSIYATREYRCEIITHRKISFYGEEKRLLVLFLLLSNHNSL